MTFHPSPYLSCSTCFSTMQGIRDTAARTTCHDCGGQALIGASERHQERVRQARSRLARYEPPSVAPRNPNAPRAA
jgi:PHP family Zn ribbon phosphoesterase